MEQSKVVMLVEENIKTIFAYALSRTANRAEAEDLAGDIALAVLQSASRLRDERAFFGYFWGIAANTYKKYLRKKGRISYGELDNDISSNEDFVSDILVRQDILALRRELALLSQEYRECTIAYYFEGLSCAQTAEKLHISLEMVKYYLFKTRKLLKEGIEMAREFGEKSYNPGKFNFNTIFEGQHNAEYQNLFSRKLPGNILLSAYYTPMTIRELAIELGVATVYLEDEIALLERYHLLTPLLKGKYQTNLIIFTEGFTQEFQKTACSFCTEEMGKILKSVKEKLLQIREIDFVGSDLDENRLLWAFLYLLMHYGHLAFEKSNEKEGKAREIYPGANGTNYGVDYEEGNNQYCCQAFAGYSYINQTYAAAFANFGILPKKNHYCDNDSSISEKVEQALANRNRAEFAIFSCEELKIILQVLQEEIQQMSLLYQKLTECASQLMKIHAPTHLEGMVNTIIFRTIYFRTVGLMGVCAVNSGMVSIPQEEGAIAMYVYQSEREW